MLINLAIKFHRPYTVFIVFIHLIFIRNAKGFTYLLLKWTFSWICIRSLVRPRSSATIYDETITYFSRPIRLINYVHDCISVPNLALFKMQALFEWFRTHWTLGRLQLALLPAPGLSGSAGHKSDHAQPVNK